jgi:mobilization protein NikA
MQKLLTVRCTPGELATWKAEAAAAGLSLSDWVRKQLGSPTSQDRLGEAVQAAAPLPQEQPAAADPSALASAVRRAAAVPVAVCRFAASGGCRRLGKVPCIACAT